MDQPVFRDLLVAVKGGGPLRMVSGGTMPITGFHSVIERPERVSRVMPPIITISQDQRAAREQPCGNGGHPASRRAGLGAGPRACRFRQRQGAASPQFAQSRDPPIKSSIGSKVRAPGKRGKCGERRRGSL